MSKLTNNPTSLGARHRNHRPALLNPGPSARLGEWLRFRPLARHPNAYGLDAEQVQRLLAEGA